MIRPFLPILLLIACIPAFAAARDGAGQLACNRDGSQVELNACAADELAAADAELNAVWRDVLAGTGDDALARERLRTAQRLWLQLRDADLAAQFPLPKARTRASSTAPSTR